MMKPTLSQILATYTKARRLVQGLTHGALAKRYGLRTADIQAVEKQRLITAETRAAMIEYNELQEWEALREQEIEGYLNAGN